MKTVLCILILKRVIYFSNEKSFLYIYVIFVKRHGLLISRNNMTSDGFEHKTEWWIENENEHETECAIS